MSGLEEKVADGLACAFKAHIAKLSGMSFEESKVSLPGPDVWLRYARAALRVVREDIEEHRRLLNGQFDVIDISRENGLFDIIIDRLQSSPLGKGGEE